MSCVSMHGFIRPRQSTCAITRIRRAGLISSSPKATQRRKSSEASCQILLLRQGFKFAMNTTEVKKMGWWARHIRKASAYGPLDRAVRQWRGLGSVRAGTGTVPNGDALVYRMNATTLEIGQGANTFKGMMGLVGLCGLCAMLFVLLVITPTYFDAKPPYSGPVEKGIVFLADLLIALPLGIAFLNVFLTDFF